MYKCADRFWFSVNILSFYNLILFGVAVCMCVCVFISVTLLQFVYIVNEMFTRMVAVNVYLIHMKCVRMLNCNASNTKRRCNTICLRWIYRLCSFLYIYSLEMDIINTIIFTFYTICGEQQQNVVHCSTFFLLLPSSYSSAAYYNTLPHCIADILAQTKWQVEVVQLVFVCFFSLSLQWAFLARSLRSDPVLLTLHISFVF